MLILRNFLEEQQIHKTQKQLMQNYTMGSQMKYTGVKEVQR